MAYGCSTEWSTTPKAILSPSIRGLEWAAGFLEGEGWFGASQGGRKHNHYSEKVVAVQASLEPLERLQRLFGGIIRHRKVDYVRKDGKVSQRWDWLIFGARARGLMMTLYSLLSARRKEAIRLALAAGNSNRGLAILR